MQVRDVALGERDDVHAGERESLEEAGRVFLVAAESVQRLGEDDVESPVQRIAHQRLESGAQQRRAGDRVIGELVSRPSSPGARQSSRQTRSWSAIEASRWLSDE